MGNALEYLRAAREADDDGWSAIADEFYAAAEREYAHTLDDRYTQAELDRAYDAREAAIDAREPRA